MISVLQIESLDKSLEDLLTRVDEFVGMLDMVRIVACGCVFEGRVNTVESVFVSKVPKPLVKAGCSLKTCWIIRLLILIIR